MKKKLFFRGPVLTRSGYGEQSRFALRALASRQDIFDIYIQPLQWGQTSWTNEITEEREWIDQTIEKTIAYMQAGGTFDVSFQVTIPNEWQKIAPINIGYTAGIETSKVAHQWIQHGNEMDGIVVVSNHAKNTFEHTEYQAHNESTGQQFMLKLDTPIVTVNYPAKNCEDLPDINLDLKTDFNFLTVAQWGPRKNLPNTVKWFIEEFKDEEVGLIVKTNMAKNCHMDREVSYGQLINLANQVAPDRKCKLYLLHGDLTDEEMHSVYNHEKVSALVALPHGEGFGLPLFESAYTGLPVIATGWSGQLDFLIDENGKNCFYNVSFDLGPVQQEVVWDGVLIADSMWSYPREQSAKHNMRLCYEDITTNKEDSVAVQSCNFADYTQDRFSQEKQYGLMVDTVMNFIGTNFEEQEEWREILDQVVEYE